MLTAKVECGVMAPSEKVWLALTDPAMVKQYMFGTEMTTDWKPGSSITYSGVWNGKPYTDKGTVVNVLPGKLLHTTFFSPMSGKDDVPENYANVIYELKPVGGQTIVVVTQDHIADEQQLAHMESNWNMVLDGLKKLVEGA